MATQNGKNKTSIGTKDRLSRLDRGGKLGVRASQLLAITLEVVVGGKSDVGTLGEIDLLCVVGEETRTDLGSLCVKKNTYIISKEICYEQVDAFVDAIIVNKTLNSPTCLFLFFEACLKRSRHALCPSWSP